MITQPYVNFILPDAGGNVKPISNGKIYIGKEGLDPKLGGNPIYYRDNEGAEVEISSPLYLNMTGVIVDGTNDSNVINPYTKAPVSMLILNKNGDPVWSELSNVTQLVSSTEVAKGSGLTFPNIEIMKSTYLPIGVKVSWQGYYDQSDGGSNWGIVKSGAHVDDGFSVFSIDANTYVEANTKGARVNIMKAGAKSGDSAFDNGAILNFAANFAIDNKMGIKAPAGTFYV